MKRITVYKNGSITNGKVTLVVGDILTLLLVAGNKLGITGKILFMQDGGEIEDIEAIRDNDVLYVSEGEQFITPNNHTSQYTKDALSTSNMNTKQTDWIELNVGGTVFATTRNTLTTKEPDSMLARMFSQEAEHPWRSKMDVSGAYLIDRSPRYFEPILNYLRHGALVIDKNINAQGVLEEAKFFGIMSLVEQIEALVERDQPVKDHSPVTRREFVLSLMSTPAKSELRCQGMNFDHADLSKLDLRNINFKYASLKHAKLMGANLSHCNFERADMAYAIMDGATLINVKLLCAHLDSATMTNCNFEDPAGSRTNMEGANMKGVDLEGSHMAGVNLRVANLKNSNLQNCDLRGAVLAGADLENCDLSGCDLQEANLRGANLKGASLELMLNPLHMSQTVTTIT